ncbi:uncharacterized protein [Nothobranchius furzeri]|uniref:LOC107379411-like protein n=1 Tax=Nothobranchius furzeri TaxID=105023 RepID=A0A9D2YBI7_NOTFU|nr:uncharacterized protein LOC107379411 isoform X2 [Nothobranchius furzeri]KAF7216304.1 putative LOC107379411-like protein [Nothobranchius furzeri]
MMVIIYLLLMLREECCAADPVIERKSIKVGDRVKMECSRRSAGDLHWMKIAFKNPPEYLEEPLDERLYSHIKVNAEPGTFQLQIINAKLNDSALYVCVRKHQGGITYLKLTYLMVEDLAVTTVPPSVPVYPKDSVILQCSVLHYSQNHSCPLDNSMYCFRAEVNQTHSNFTNTQRDIGIKNVSEGFTAETCFYSHLKSFRSSGVQMNYCGVSVPKEKIPEDKSKHTIKGETASDSQNYNTILYMLCAALAMCLIIIASLLCYIKNLKETSDECFIASVALHEHTPLEENQEAPDG